MWLDVSCSLIGGQEKALPCSHVAYMTLLVLGLSHGVRCIVRQRSYWLLLNRPRRPVLGKIPREGHHILESPITCPSYSCFEDQSHVHRMPLCGEVSGGSLLSHVVWQDVFML